jgi:hypothetical protein
MLAWVLAGCTPDPTVVTVFGPDEPALRDAVAMVGHPGLSFEAGDPRGRGRAIVLSDTPSVGPGAYRIEVDGRRIEVAGGDVLGMQFGLAVALEAMDVRFVHPSYTVFPTELGEVEPEEVSAGRTIAPETPRNGLQMHTLHPIEGTYDFWEPSEAGLERARRTIDWLVKNRGNHLQYPALDDILGPAGAAWAEHTAAIVEYAHQRGITVSFGVQLFGSGNLQLAFDLVDGAEFDRTVVDQRLDVLAQVAPDGFDLSFGEFSGEDPEAFVETATAAVERMHAAVPGAEVSTVIHVGNYDDLQVEYLGEQLQYYFLAKHVDGAVPLVHSVMYYNLFEDAGGAYLHDEFDEHRAFLLERVRAGEPVGYFPESAYWVAFDNSVPTYLPLYIRSRFTDLARIREEGGQLQNHVLFSSGWEWGYWQNDVLTMRMAHRLPATWGDAVHDLFAPWGEDGQALADAVVALGDLQHEVLLVDRLAPYLAGRDALIDVGDAVGILSQPDRPRVDQVLGLGAAERAQVDAAVAGLARMAEETEAIGAFIADVGTSEPVFDEVRDGMAVDALRARFVSDVYRSVRLLGDGDPEGAEAALVAAESGLEEARGVVSRRHGALWWAGGDRLTAQEDANATIYQFGYLAKADSLCYWDRELARARNAVRGASASVPPCT